MPIREGCDNIRKRPPATDRTEKNTENSRRETYGENDGPKILRKELQKNSGETFVNLGTAKKFWGTPKKFVSFT